jgi:hypothetical protein
MIPKTPINVDMLNLKPGDVLACEGTAYDSWIIRLFTWGPSHTSIVACSDPVLVFESTTLSKFPCYFAGRCISGIQAHLPEDAVQNYCGKVWVLRRRASLTSIQQARLCLRLHQRLGQPYSKWKAIVSATLILKTWIWWMIVKLGGTFCSYTVADALNCALFDVDSWTEIDPELTPAQVVQRIRRSKQYHEPERIR